MTDTAPRPPGPWWTFQPVVLTIAPPEPEPLTLTCPCPLKGLRCGDCMMIAFAPPPFTATPFGWALATLRRLGWRIRDLFTTN